MKLLKIAVAALAICFFTVALAGAEGVSVSASSRLWSKYLSENNDGVIYDRPILRNNITIGLPHSFYVDVLHFMSVGGGLNSNTGDEVDLTLGWNGSLTKGLSMDVGLSYFDLARIGTVTKGDMLQPYVELSQDILLSRGHTVASYFREEILIATSATSPAGGFVTKFGLKDAWKLNDLMSVAQRAGLMYDDGTLGFQSALLAQYQGTLSWNVSPHVSLEFPSVRVSVPLTSLHDNRTSQFIVGSGVVLRF